MSQRMRKNVSPGAGTKQGPIRATVPLSLMHQNSSPTKGLMSSPSPDANRIKTSPETHSTPGRGEKLKCSSGPYIRRTASVDTIYLLGQWQRDALHLSYCGRLMMDRATQTPDDFLEEKLLQKRACSESLEMKFIRQRIQKTSHSTRLVGRQSPDPLSGGGLSPPTLPSTSPQQGGSNACAISSAVSSSSCALPIPIPDIPKPLIPRMRSSVEGLNQEIERLVLREIAYFEDGSLQNLTPEGHHAPIADLFYHTQSVDTQTPFSTSSSSGNQSISPLVPLFLEHMDTSRPPSTESKDSPDMDSTHRLGASPHINKFLAREPPDGCEKVKIAEESRNLSSFEIPEYSCPKPSMNFVLLPSRRSAFYPLCKNCGLPAPNGDQQ